MRCPIARPSAGSHLQLWHAHLSSRELEISILLTIDLSGIPQLHVRPVPRYCRHGANLMKRHGRVLAFLSLPALIS